MPAIIDEAPAKASPVDTRNFSPAVLDMDEVDERVEKSILKKARKLVDVFPERALHVIRGWMAE